VVELKTLQPDGSYADPEAAPAEETPAEEPAKA
jgi:trigger factor